MNNKAIDTANIIYNTAISTGINNLVASFIVSQAAHETGGFTSDLFNRANNAFGMTVPKLRKSPFIIAADKKQPDGSGNYAKYLNVQDSTKDLIHWFTYNGITLNTITSPEQYANVLKSKGYYGDTVQNYLSGLKTYLAKFNGLLKNHSSLIIIYIIAVVFLLFILK